MLGEVGGRPQAEEGREENPRRRQVGRVPVGRHEAFAPEASQCPNTRSPRDSACAVLLWPEDRLRRRVPRVCRWRRSSSEGLPNAPAW